AELLADGPLRVSEVWARARADGLSRTTLRRAKKELDVRSVWGSVDGHPVSYWALGDEEPAPAAPAEDDETSLEPWLGPLRRKYPGPTPLDDL
ncbi:MAG TPA: hypothetical protein VFA26_06065, partial [Gemmataceae bacterium]|nr:hypothetical protein [Gemmataceae bacterium]